MFTAGSTAWDTAEPATSEAPTTAPVVPSMPGTYRVYYQTHNPSSSEMMSAEMLESNLKISVIYQI